MNSNQNSIFRAVNSSVNSAIACRNIWGGIFNPTTLDIGRILASSLVFYFHVGRFEPLPLSAYGEKAVEYFVVLAGISYVLFSRAALTRPAGYRTYIYKLLISLLQVYLLVNLIIYIISFFIPLRWAGHSVSGSFLRAALA